MNRREFLQSTAIGALGLAAASYGFSDVYAKDVGDGPLFCGWIDNPAARKEFLKSVAKPLFRQWDGDIRGSGADKQIILLRAYEKVTGHDFIPRRQTIGDCVGQGSALAADVLTSSQIVILGQNEEWKGDCSTEVVYAGSRVEIASNPGRFDGSNGIHAAKFLQQYGVVLRGQYGDIDLSTYRPDLARKWAASREGIPAVLEAVAKEHPVHTIARIDSFDEYADAIANGYPVILCSNQGFQRDRGGVAHRDNDGYLKPGGYWSHCMLGCGLDTKSERKGGLIANSWGSKWVTGPEGPVGCPAGCFWADAKVIDRMVKQQDSYVISNYAGYPKQELDYHLF